MTFKVFSTVLNNRFKISMIISNCRVFQVIAIWKQETYFRPLLNFYWWKAFYDFAKRRTLKLWNSCITLFEIVLLGGKNLPRVMKKVSIPKSTFWCLMEFENNILFQHISVLGAGMKSLNVNHVDSIFDENLLCLSAYF